jgi:hypothetical protein
MKTRKTLRMLCAVSLALAAASCGMPDDDADIGGTGTQVQALAAASTGQGIMVDLTTSGTLALVVNQVWHFNQNTAAGYFTNAWDGNAPAVSCSGNACNRSFCSIPAAPPPPAADPNMVTNPGGSAAADKSRCTFLNGGLLTRTDSYQQSGQRSVSCSAYLKTWSATYTYRYTYVVAPAPDTAEVAAFTAWDLVSETGDGSTAHVDIAALIAGESVVTKANWPRKYSFSLLDGTVDLLTGLPVPRVKDLAISIDGQDAAPVGATYVQNAPGALPGDPGALDFNYVTNAGTNGNVSLLADGDARTILNTDSFDGNQNGGADGQALAAMVLDPVGADLGAGDHTVTLTGTVKGNNASATADFSVTQTVHIITPGCGQ